jgi:hypothetical protein
MKALMSVWYHFAIMFEALFILTTIDAGTRVARFLLQEFGGRIWKPFERTDWIPGTILSTSLVVFAWGYFIWTGNISSIWPMFGTANQLLAAVALAVATSAIINAGKERYAWVTLLPMLFVAATTLSACWLNITDNFWPMTANPQTAVQGYINSVLTAVIMALPKRTDIHSVLIIGAGPIIIGQACEFDYSGTQACKALKEEGYRVILINSNPATIMTDPEFADRTYIEPITPECVEKIIGHRRRDCERTIATSSGGMRPGARARGVLSPISMRSCIEESVIGWKEYELEVMRDVKGQCRHRLLHRELRPDGDPHGRLGDGRSGPDPDGQGISVDARRCDQDHPRYRRGNRRVEYSVRGRPADGPLPGDRDESPRLAVLGARVEGDRVSDREDRGEAGGRLHPGRDTQRHHEADPCVVRAHDRLLCGEDPPLGLREIQGSGHDAGRSDEIRR